MQVEAKVKRERTMTKVLHVTYDMRIGGTEQVIRNLVENVDPSLIESHIFCIEQPLGPWGEELKSTGICIEEVNRQPGFDRSLIQAIRAYVKEHRINVVHCHQYTPYVYGVLAAIGLPAKVIFTEHGRFYPDSGSWKRKLINPCLSLFTKHITSISKATLEALVEHENFRRGAIKVIYNAIADIEDKLLLDDSSSLKRSLNIPEDALVFGTIARLDPIKNQLMMVRAFARTLEQIPNAILMIVGDGDMRGELDRLVDQLGIRTSVVFTGYQSRPHAYLALMDIYLLSSLSEGTSMTLLEAMAASKPCVVTDAGGNPEIVINELNGLVTPNDDEEAFAEAMVKLGLSKDLQQRYAAAARERYQMVFSVDKMIESFQTLYLGS